MDATYRKITIMQAWAKDKRGGLEIKFTGHNPTMLNNIPHPWVCVFGTKNENYTGYGTSLPTAVDAAYSQWQAA